MLISGIGYKYAVVAGYDERRRCGKNIKGVNGCKIEMYWITNEA